MLVGRQLGDPVTQRLGRDSSERHRAEFDIADLREDVETEVAFVDAPSAVAEVDACAQPVVRVLGQRDATGRWVEPLPFRSVGELVGAPVLRGGQGREVLGVNSLPSAP